MRTHREDVTTRMLAEMFDHASDRVKRTREAATDQLQKRAHVLADKVVQELKRTEEVHDTNALFMVEEDDEGAFALVVQALRARGYEVQRELQCSPTAWNYRIDWTDADQPKVDECIDVDEAAPYSAAGGRRGR